MASREQKCRDETMAVLARLMVQIENFHVTHDVLRVMLKRFLELLEAEKARRPPHRPTDDSLGFLVEVLIKDSTWDKASQSEIKLSKPEMLKLTTEIRRRVAEEHKKTPRLVAQAHRRFLLHRKQELRARALA
jgi:hypothetical protein